MGEGASIIFPQGILSGDIFSLSSNPPFVTVKEGLQNALKNNTGTLLRIMESTVAIQKQPNGCYKLFDPHARSPSGFVDGNGFAVILLFLTLDSVLSHIRKFVRQRGSETDTKNSVDSLSIPVRSFELLPIAMCKLGQQENGSCLSQLIRGTVPQNSSCFKK